MVTVIQLISTGYDDYIAARVLLKHNYWLQGATLASSSVEKYLKALLLKSTGSIKKVHLNNIEELLKLYEKTEYKLIFNSLDKVFLKILGDAYDFRYYDNIKKSTALGFIVNQFIAELDYTVYLFESLFTMEIGGKITPTKYHREIEAKNPDLFNDNFILNNLNKIEFMERPSKLFGIYFNPSTSDPITISNDNIKPPPYKGQIMNVEVLEANSAG